MRERTNVIAGLPRALAIMLGAPRAGVEQK
jgi:hypothetical protein